jgi:hypothetical protein
MAKTGQRKRRNPSGGKKQKSWKYRGESSKLEAES